MKQLIFGFGVLMLLVCCLVIIGCNEQIETPKEKVIKTPEQLAQLLKSNIKPEPLNEVAFLDETQEKKLFSELADAKVTIDFADRIAIIRRNQQKFLSAATWLSQPTFNQRDYIENRYKIANLLFQAKMLRESLELCEVKILPDEVSPKYQEMFTALKTKILQSPK